MGVLQFLRPRPKEKPLDSPIRFVLLHEDGFSLQETEVMKKFQERFGHRLALQENPQWSDPGRGIRGFLATDGDHGALVYERNDPLPASLLEMLLEQSRLEREIEEKIRKHAGNVVVHYASAAARAPALDQVRFVAKLLLTLAEHRSIIAAVNISGQGVFAGKQLHSVIWMT